MTDEEFKKIIVNEIVWNNILLSYNILTKSDIALQYEEQAKNVAIKYLSNIK